MFTVDVNECHYEVKSQISQPYRCLYNQHINNADNEYRKTRTILMECNFDLQVTINYIAFNILYTNFIYVLLIQAYAFYTLYYLTYK